MKIKLTDKLISKSKPKSERYEVWDEMVSNLLMTIYPSGRKSWSVRYRADGKRIKMKLGEYPGNSLRDARAKARDALLSVFEGGNPAYERKDLKNINSAKRTDLLNRITTILDEYRDLRLSQLRTGNQAVIFLKEFRAQYGGLEIDNFNRRDFVKLTNSILVAGNGTKANRVHTHVKTFYNWAIGQGYIDYNPCDRVSKPFKEVARSRFLSSDEIGWFWKATSQDLEPFGQMARLLLLTGQRLNECAKMTESEIINFDRWNLKPTRTKNGNTHDIYLSRQARAVVDRLGRVTASGGYIFTTTGNSPVKSFDKPIKRLRKSMNEISGLELDHFTYHDLRRTCETGLAALKTPQEVIDRITNHLTGRGMARVYNQYDYWEEKADAMQRWADKIDELVR